MINATDATKADTHYKPFVEKNAELFGIQYVLMFYLNKSLQLFILVCK